MAEKCAVCGSKVEKTFLHKPLGTFVRDGAGKRKLVCQQCQRTLTMDAIKEKL